MASGTIGSWPHRRGAVEFSDLVYCISGLPVRGHSVGVAFI